MTAPQTEAATDPQNIIAVQQRLDAALAREAALTEALADQEIGIACGCPHMLTLEFDASPNDDRPLNDWRLL